MHSEKQHNSGIKSDKWLKDLHFKRTISNKQNLPEILESLKLSNLLCPYEQNKNAINYHWDIASQERQRSEIAKIATDHGQHNVVIKSLMPLIPDLVYIENEKPNFKNELDKIIVKDNMGRTIQERPIY